MVKTISFFNGSSSFAGQLPTALYTRIVRTVLWENGS